MTSNQPKLKWSAFEKYLTACELGGRRARLTIDRIEIEETHPRQGVTEACPVLYFRETKRGLVLSRTNRRALAKAFGDEAEACIGKKIIVAAVAVQVANKQTTPIRITAPAPTKVDKTTGEIIEGPTEDIREPVVIKPSTPTPAPGTEAPTPGTQAVAVQVTENQPASMPPSVPAPAAAVTTASRPKSAERVREAIRASGGAVPGKPNDQYLAGTMASLAGLVNGNDANRHAILKYLFGVDSGKQLTSSQCRALRGWIGAERNDADEWIPNAFSVEEAKLMLRAFAIERGQRELPLQVADQDAADALNCFGQAAKPVGR
jgi:hypothetical protein